MNSVKLFLITLFFFLLLEDEDYHPTTYVFPAFKHTLGIRRAGATELFLFMGFKVKFRNPEGLACARLDSWEDPEDPHDDDELTVYGVNSGQNNIIYNSSMWGLDVFNIDEDDGLRVFADQSLDLFRIQSQGFWMDVSEKRDSPGLQNT